MMNAELIACDDGHATSATNYVARVYPTMTGIDDKEIENAFEEMLPTLARIFGSVCSPADVDDLLAVTRHKVMQRHQHRDRQDYKRPHPWIKRVALNVAMNRNRKEQRRGELREELGQANPSARQGRAGTPMTPFRTLRGGDCVVAEDRQTPEGRLIKQEERELLWNCIRQLGPEESVTRTTLAIHYADVPGFELADGLGIAPGTLYSRVKRGKDIVVDLVRSLLNHLANRDAPNPRSPWNARKLAATRTVWDWIWAQDEAHAQTAMLVLFGKVEWDALERFEFFLDVDWDMLAHLESQLIAAGWN